MVSEGKNLSMAEKHNLITIQFAHKWLVGGSEQAQRGQFKMGQEGRGKPEVGEWVIVMCFSLKQIKRRLTCMRASKNFEMKYSNETKRSQHCTLLPETNF
jgi:hypothetical protein